ncbi:hypothetical protein PM082_003890 [Marasmius tenuissimus]|nr:hypothetical protein PM082_003890 [Marasmius tenuissimus]
MDSEGTFKPRITQIMIGYRQYGSRLRLQIEGSESIHQYFLPLQRSAVQEISKGNVWILIRERLPSRLIINTETAHYFTEGYLMPTCRSVVGQHPRLQLKAN